MLPQRETVVAAGAESMSGYPLLFDEGLKNAVQGAMEGRSVTDKFKALVGLRPRHLKPVAALLQGLKDAYSGVNMGQTAEAMAKIHDLSREEQDRVALESHQRLAAAWEEGRMRDEVVPVCPPPDWSEVVYLSPAIETIYGHRPDAFRARPELWIEVIHPDDRDEVLAFYHEHHGRPTELEYRIVRPDGDVRWIRDVATPIHDRNGDLELLSGFAVDVTARKATEAGHRRFASLVDASSASDDTR